MALRIIVLVKQVPDPEGPPASFQVDAEHKRIVPRGIPPVINPFDENALEAAIRIKEKQGGEIILLTLGRNISRALILKAVASGADASVVAEDPSFDHAVLDPARSASLLAAAVDKMGGFDLILCGRQASDTNAGQVGLGMAHYLGIPAITLAKSVDVMDGRVVVERVLAEGYEVWEAPLPCLVTVSSEIGDLRYPSLQAIKAAKSLNQILLTRSDLEASLSVSSKVKTLFLSLPSRERNCVVVEAESHQEAGRLLARKLVEDKVI